MVSRKKSKIVKTNIAGPKHAVTSVLSDDKGYRREVCEQCPFRLDAKIGEFPAKAFKISATTAYDAAFNTFACHMSGADHPKVCAGFLLTQGVHNLGVRLLASREDFEYSEMRQTVPLYKNYREMAVANGVDPNDPVLERCRDDGQIRD